MVISKCGKTHSKRGKPFTDNSLRQHQRDCDWCIELMRLDGTHVEEHEDMSPYGDDVVDTIVTSDESDGVYFAIRYEMRG